MLGNDICAEATMARNILTQYNKNIIRVFAGFCISTCNWKWKNIFKNFTESRTKKISQRTAKLIKSMAVVCMVLSCNAQYGHQQYVVVTLSGVQSVANKSGVGVTSLVLESSVVQVRTTITWINWWTKPCSQVLFSPLNSSLQVAKLASDILTMHTFLMS